MERVLVTGADGFIGSALCRALKERGYLVRRALRKDAPDAEGMESVTVGDIGPGTCWDDAIKGVEYVVHLAARVHVLKECAGDPLGEFRKVNVEGTRRLAEKAAEVSAKNFIYISSIGVNGSETLDGECRRFTEDDIPDPENPYAVSKLEAEEVLKSIGERMGLNYVILRPPLVYAFGAPGNFGTLVKVVEKGLPLPLGSIKNRRSFIYLGNLVDIIITCLGLQGSFGKVYLVCDGEDVSTPEFIRRVADASGKPARLFPFPETLLKLVGKITGKTRAVERLLGSLVVDDGRIRKELGWRPPYSMSEGLSLSLSGRVR